MPQKTSVAIWNVLSLLFSIISFSLLVDTGTRLFSGGPDTIAVITVMSQAVLAALSIGSALTNSGSMAYQSLLLGLGIPKPKIHYIKFLSSVIISIILLTIRLSLPNFAVAYNDQGVRKYSEGQLLSAQYNFVRAIHLNPDYAEAHYNLGRIHEELNNFDEARTEYRFAAISGLDAAYSNLARLNILDGNYSEAVSLLLLSLEKIEDDEIRYVVYKNLGWARLKQNRYSEASSFLQQAINLNPDQASANCLMAQVQEELNQTDKSILFWENCIRFASELNPDEDTWLGLARERLSPGGVGLP